MVPKEYYLWKKMCDLSGIFDQNRLQSFPWLMGSTEQRSGLAPDASTFEPYVFQAKTKIAGAGHSVVLSMNVVRVQYATPESY